MTRSLALLLLLVPFIHSIRADEQSAKVPFPHAEKLAIQSGLPDPFMKSDGSRVGSREEWPAQRRYLKEMLAHYQYGTMPPRPGPGKVSVKRLSSQSPFPESEAVLERYALTVSRGDKSATFHFELIRNDKPGRHPVIIKNDGRSFTADHNGARADLKAARIALLRGYYLCKFLREEVAADSADNRSTGIFPLYPDYDWGTIAAWAWAHGVVADALDQLEIADMSRLVATGHSRGGKAALCAGIYDERIAITAPNSSGTGGTGSMRYFENGQREQRLILHKTQFPHWWVDRYYQFGGMEDRLPYDAHTAKALIAPRALFNAHAKQDYWANPYGTELTYRAANIVFNWLGKENGQGIHWREGGHAQNATDWMALLDFVDRQFSGKAPRGGLTRFSTLAYPEAKLPVEWSAPK